MKKIFYSLIVLFFLTTSAFSLNDFFKRGKEQYKLGKYDNAITLFKLSLTKYKNKDMVYYYLGKSYYESGNIELVLNEFNKVKNAEKLNLMTGDYYYYLQLTKIQLNQINNNDIKKYYKLFKNSLKVEFINKIFELDKKELAEFIFDFTDKLLHKDILNFAIKLFKNNNYQNCLNLINFIAPKTDNSIELKLKILCNYQLKNYAESIKNADKFLKLNDDEKIKTLRDKSLKLYQKEKNKKMRDFYFKAENLFDVGNYSEAKKLYEKIIDLFPNNSTYFEIEKSKEKLTIINNIEKKVKVNEIKKTILYKKDLSEKLNFLKQNLELLKSDSSWISNVLKNEINKSNTEKISKLYDFVSLEESRFTKNEIKNLYLLLFQRFLDFNNKDFCEKIIVKLKEITADANLIKSLQKKIKINYLKYIIILIIFVMFIYFIKKYLGMHIKTFFYIFRLWFTDNNNVERKMSLVKKIIKSTEINFLSEKYKLILCKLAINSGHSDYYDSFFYFKDYSLFKEQELYKIIEHFYRVSDFEKAINIAKKSYKQYPKSSEILRIYFLINKELKNSEEIINIGKVYLKLHFNQEIIKECIYHSFLIKDNNTGRFFLKSWLKTQSNAIRHIIDFINDLIGEFGEQDVLLSILGPLYRKTKETEKAIEVYEKLFYLKKNKMPVFSVLNKLYKEIGNDEKQMFILEEIIKINEYNFNEKLDLAKIYMKINRYDEAVEILSELLLKNKDSLEVTNLLVEISVVYKNNDQVQKQIKIYEFIINNSFSNTNEIKLNLGRTYNKLHEYDNAISALQKIKSGDINLRYRAQIQIANALLGKKDYKLALDVLNSINDIEIGLSDEVKKVIYYNKSLAFIELGNIETAKEFLQKLIIMDINYKNVKELYDNLLNK